MPQEGNGMKMETKLAPVWKTCQKVTMHKVPGSHHELTTINLPNPFDMQSICGRGKKDLMIKWYKIDKASLLE